MHIAYAYIFKAHQFFVSRGCYGTFGVNMMRDTRSRKASVHCHLFLRPFVSFAILASVLRLEAENGRLSAPPACDFEKEK